MKSRLQKFLWIFVVLIVGCTSKSSISALPNLDETIEFYKENPAPLPEFVNQIEKTGNQVCIRLDNGVLGQFSNQQTDLVKKGVSIHLNMQKISSFTFQENMASLRDNSGEAVDTGISAVCFDIPSDVNDDALAYFELTFSADQKFVYTWVIEGE